MNMKLVIQNMSMKFVNANVFVNVRNQAVNHVSHVKLKVILA
ncbi:hypothetical protein SDC9_137432 [bioreactor metagenome]|uniref:Uncharacterized protein n=1 Tax=bioreactor metagenome TaxID=1076179 RepID=A0A645DM43_9ZZZZ